MNSTKIRCVNDKGAVKFLVPKIALNAKRLAAHGFVLQDERFDQNGVPKTEQAANMIPQNLRGSIYIPSDFNEAEPKQVEPQEEPQEAQIEKEPQEEPQIINHKYGVSKDHKAKEAIAIMAELDVEDLDAFVKGESRKTVKDKYNELTK